MFAGVEGDIKATFKFGAGEATVFDAQSSIRECEVKEVHNRPNRHGNTLHCVLMMYERSRLMSVDLLQKYFVSGDMDWRVKLKSTSKWSNLLFKMKEWQQNGLTNSCCTENLQEQCIKLENCSSDVH